MLTMYPIKLNPVFKEIVWGGNRLKSDYNYKSELNNIAEAWVLTARPDGDNTVINGEFEGESFTKVIKEHKEYLGTKGTKYEEFPLLIKFIDAKSDLSVQVHPDDEYARIHENSYGKTEAWYVLDCEDGAELIYGFNKKISKEEFRKSVEDNTFLQYVNKVKVKKGDIFFISAGTLHAIGGGILLAEVQQNCNTTYRVYDYGRLVNGKPRELHIEKAMDVTVTDVPSRSTEPEGSAENCGDAVKTDLPSCEFFKMTSLDVDGNCEITVGDESFVSLLILDGEGTLTSNITELTLNKGESVFLPASLGKVTLGGKFKSLISTL